MMLQIKFALLYILYSISLSWYKVLHGEHAEEFFVEKAKYPRIALKLLGTPIGKNCRIRNGLVLYNYSKNRLTIGDNVHIGKNVFLDLSDSIRIGNNCTISMGSKILTHMDVGDSTLKEGYPPTHGPIDIENNVYIGAASTVLFKAKKLSNKTLLAAHSLLDQPTIEGGIYAGSPAILKKQSTKPS